VYAGDIKAPAQIPGLLGNPMTVGVLGHRDLEYLSGRKLDEEQDVRAREAEGVHGEEVAGELSASDLAREFGMSAQTVNVLVKGLEACGLVRRVSHPDHGRILLASLTPAGRRALARGRELAFVVENRFLSDLSSADRSTLMRCVKAIEKAAR
jgi:DNA-binding MarR family transcriptional regulator